MSNCLHCSNPLSAAQLKSKGIFCSHRCANLGRPREVRERQRVSLLRTIASTKTDVIDARRRQQKKTLLLKRLLESEENKSNRKAVRRLQRDATILSSPFDDLSFESKRRRVFIEQSHSCNHCSLSEWRGHPITLEIEHKDGNNSNHSRDNLEGVCPNCHSLTSTWRGRNKSNTKITDSDLISALKSASSIHQALIQVNLTPKGGNYRRAQRLLEKLVEDRVGLEPTVSLEGEDG